MNGLLAIVAGTWALCQAFGGNALERLGVLGDSTATDLLNDPHGGLPDHDFGPNGVLKL